MFNGSFLVVLPPDNQMFQYFITVVPTKLNTHKISADTHQFSVTERVSEWGKGNEKLNPNELNPVLCVSQERLINHAAGSHGVSGIFLKYDTSSLMVTVSEQHMPLGQFLVRLCGIIGGIFSTTGESTPPCNDLSGKNSLHFDTDLYKGEDLGMFLWLSLTKQHHVARRIHFLSSQGCSTGLSASASMWFAVALNWEATGPERWVEMHKYNLISIYISAQYRNN